MDLQHSSSLWKYVFSTLFQEACWKQILTGRWWGFHLRKHIGPFVGLWANFLVTLQCCHLEIGHKSHFLLLWEGCYKEKTTGLRKGMENMCIKIWASLYAWVIFDSAKPDCISIFTWKEQKYLMRILNLFLLSFLFALEKSCQSGYFFFLWLLERWLSWKDLYLFFRLQHVSQLKSAHLLEIMWASFFKPWIRGLLPWIKMYPQGKDYLQFRNVSLVHLVAAK